MEVACGSMGSCRESRTQSHLASSRRYVYLYCTLIIHGEAYRLSWRSSSAGWPDSSKGLYDLKKKYIISTCSHGSVRLLVDMAKHTDLPWDLVFSSELVRSYKPYVSSPSSSSSRFFTHLQSQRHATRHITTPCLDPGIPKSISAWRTTSNYLRKE